jgi:hypothetical protein
MRVDPPEPRAGQPIVFYASFLNTTGSPQTYDWCIVIWRPENFPDQRRSDGISTCTPKEIPVGETEQPSTGWDVPRIGGCDPKLAAPVLIDAAGARIPFVRPNDGDFWFDFTICP